MNSAQKVYDMFYGYIDPQIIEDVILNFGGNIQRATEYLLELAPITSAPNNSFLYIPPPHQMQPQRMPVRFPPITYLHDFFPAPSHRYPMPPLGCANAFGVIPNQSRSFHKQSKSKNQDSVRSSFSCTGIAKANNASSGLENEELQHSTIMSQKDALFLMKNYLTKKQKVLVILRGCPGAGKTTLARQIRFSGVILSTDYFFSLNGEYNFSAANLSEAHDWNRKQAEQAMKECKNPIIIDNTNVQVWEMLPYAALANKYGYTIEVIEPDVQWRLNPSQLAKKNIHGVKKEKIINMLNRYDGNITGSKLLEMVRGKEKDTESQQTIPDQQELPHSTDDYFNPSKASSNTWSNLRYGDRSKEDTLDDQMWSDPDVEVSSLLSDSNMNDRGSWDGVCSTLGEWMDWGEKDDEKHRSDEDGGEVDVLKIDDDSKAEASELSNFLCQKLKIKDNNVDVTKEASLSSSCDAVKEKIEVKVLQEVKDIGLCSRKTKNDDILAVADLVKFADKLEEELYEKCDMSVGTNDEDAAMISKLEEEGYHGNLGNFRAIVTPCKHVSFKCLPKSLPCTPSKRLLRYGLDKSAQTSDVMDDYQTLQLLENCFPDVDPEQIKILYEEKGHEPSILVNALTEIGKVHSYGSNREESSDSGEDACPSSPTTTEGGNAVECEKSSKPKPNLNKLLPLAISPELGEQLLNLFGKPPNFEVTRGDKGYEVEMSFELAHMIYQTWTGGLIRTSKSLDNSTDKVQQSHLPKRHIAESNSIMTSELKQESLIASQSNTLSTKIKYKQLLERFPKVNKKIIWNIYEASGYVMDVTAKTIEDSPELMEPAKIAMTDEFAANLESSQLAMAIEASLTLSEEESYSCFGTGDSYLQEAHLESVEKAKNYEKMFKENIGKAKNAFGQKQFLQANHYSTVAQEWKKKYHEEKNLIAELLVQKMAESSLQSGMLDLHGLKVKEALNLVSQIFFRYGNELSKKRSCLFLITGRGLHSASGIARIKPSVENYLTQNGYR